MCTGFTRDTHQYFMKASPVRPGEVPRVLRRDRSARCAIRLSRRRLQRLHSSNREVLSAQGRGVEAEGGRVGGMAGGGGEPLFAPAWRRIALGLIRVEVDKMRLVRQADLFPHDRDLHAVRRRQRTKRQPVRVRGRPARGDGEGAEGGHGRLQRLSCDHGNAHSDVNRTRANGNHCKRCGRRTQLGLCRSANRTCIRAYCF